MDSEKKSATSGIGFVGALQIAFIVLKLIGVINWSWLWVLSPIWITTLMGILITIIIFIFINWMNK